MCYIANYDNAVDDRIEYDNDGDGDGDDDNDDDDDDGDDDSDDDGDDDDNGNDYKWQILEAAQDPTVSYLLSIVNII